MQLVGSFGDPGSRLGALPSPTPVDARPWSTPRLEYKLVDEVGRPPDPRPASAYTDGSSHDMPSPTEDGAALLPPGARWSNQLLVVTCSTPLLFALPAPDVN